MTNHNEKSADDIFPPEEALQRKIARLRDRYKPGTLIEIPFRMIGGNPEIEKLIGDICDFLDIIDAQAEALRQKTEENEQLRKDAKWFIQKAWDAARAYGILEDKAAHCIDAQMKRDYESRMGYFIEQKMAALQQFNPPAPEQGK